MKIVFYTSGTTGTGRIVHGMAISNAIKRKGIKCDYIILNSSSSAWLADKFNIKHIEIPVEDLSFYTKKNYPKSILYHTIANLQPDILIVDRLWFPLYNFIDELSCKKIFITLQVSDDFFKVDLPDQTIRFENNQYNRILAIEPLKSIIEMDMINPLIIRNRDEIFDREKALERFELNGEKEVYLIALNKKEGYLEKLINKYSYLKDEGYDVIYSSNLEGSGIFPIVDYFNAIDLIICGAGYNQFWEAIYFNKETIFEALPSVFEDQSKRIRECQEYYFDENGADQLVEIMMNM